MSMTNEPGHGAMSESARSPEGDNPVNIAPIYNHYKLTGSRRADDTPVGISYQSIPGSFMISNPTTPSSTATSTPSPTVRETHHITLNYDPYNGKTVLNQYEIFHELGRGQHGKVRLARDLQTQEYVAIKVVDRVGNHLGRIRNFTNKAPLSNETNHEEKIKREIAILKKCIHPHIVRLIEVMDDTNSRKIYLVLEYCQRGELIWKAADSDEPAMSSEQARATFRDLLLGVEFLHFQGIIHRDIKPANLLLSEDGVVKISDFGVSYASSIINNNQDDEVELAKTAGTPAFFAPELCILNDTTPRPAITNKIDIWALGVTLYCFLFGRVPFTAESEYALFQVISDQPVYFPDDEEYYQKKIPDREDKDSHRRRFLFEEEELEEERKEDQAKPPRPLFAPPDIEDYALAKDLINKLLEKDPAKRIGMLAIKHHPWVTKNMTQPQFDAFQKFNNSFIRTPIVVSTEETNQAVTNITITHRIRKQLSKLGNTALQFAGLGRRPRSHIKNTTVGGVSTPDLNTTPNPSSHSSLESFYEFNQPGATGSSVGSPTMRDAKNPYKPLTPTLLSTSCHISDVDTNPHEDEDNEEYDDNALRQVNSNLSRNTSNKSRDSTRTARSYYSEADFMPPVSSPLLNSIKSPITITTPTTPASGALESLNNIIQRTFSNNSGKVSRNSSSPAKGKTLAQTQVGVTEDIQSPQFTHPPKINHKNNINPYAPQGFPFGHNSSFIADVIHDDPNNILLPRPTYPPPTYPPPTYPPLTYPPPTCLPPKSLSKDTDNDIVEFPRYHSHDDSDDDDNGELTLILGPRSRADSSRALMGMNNKVRSKSVANDSACYLLHNNSNHESFIKDMREYRFGNSEDDYCEKAIVRPRTVPADDHEDSDSVDDDNNTEVEDLRQNLFKARLLKQVGVEVDSEGVGGRKRGSSITIGQLQRPKAFFDL